MWSPDCSRSRCSSLTGTSLLLPSSLSSLAWFSRWSCWFSSGAAAAAAVTMKSHAEERSA